MKIHAAQLDQVWEDKEANYAKAEKMLAETKPDSGDLFVLPETFPTCFSMNATLTTADEPEKTETFLSGLARQHKVWLTAGMTVPAESSGDKPRNLSVTFNPEGVLVGRYAKLHPAAIYHEHETYGAGEEVITFPLAGFTACPFICYDLRFPEIFRIGTRKGANLFLVIAN